MMESGILAGNGWLRILHPGAAERLGRVRHVLFDFDGTLSVLRQGWEEVMAPVMVEAICGSHPAFPEIELEVSNFIERSSGVLTIKQMQWLAETVRRHALTAYACTAEEYKALYLRRLMVFVRERIDRLACGETTPAENMIAGAREFAGALAQRGARLYLASGTDHADVVSEAAVLGLLSLFQGRVYGAVDGSEEHSKERVIQRILDANDLHGDELLVVGDGPLEIREGAQRGALALGIASDELARSGWNPRKIERLMKAGADLLIADFAHAERLAALLMDGEKA